MDIKNNKIVEVIDDENLSDVELICKYIKYISENDLRVGEIIEVIRDENGDLLHVENKELLEMIRKLF